MQLFKCRQHNDQIAGIRSVHTGPYIIYMYIRTYFKYPDQFSPVYIDDYFVILFKYSLLLLL